MKKCPDEYIGRWFSVFHRLSISYICNGLKEFGIGNGQIMFLLELYHRDGVKQETLSTYLSIDRANTTRALNKLEQAGYVIRKVDEQDKRAFRIYLTDKALRIKPNVLELMSNWEDMLLGDLSAEERIVFLRLTKKIGHSAIENNRCALCEDSC